MVETGQILARLIVGARRDMSEKGEMWNVVERAESASRETFRAMADGGGFFS